MPWACRKPEYLLMQYDYEETGNRGQVSSWRMFADNGKTNQFRAVFCGQPVFCVPLKPA
jgi:hypothetical protein